jgi:hypothetical protein
VACRLTRERRVRAPRRGSRSVTVKVRRDSQGDERNCHWWWCACPLGGAIGEDAAVDALTITAANVAGSEIAFAFTLAGWAANPSSGVVGGGDPSDDNQLAPY